MALEDIELPPSRLEPPASLAHICRSDRYERVTHSYGKSYRDVVRAFRGRFDNPTDVVAHPADEADVERVLAWCEEAGAAAIPFGGGTSVVGGVEPPGDRPSVTIDLRALDRVLEVDRDLARRAHPGGRDGPAPRGAAPRARAHAAPLPAVVRVLDARGLDRHAGGRPLRDAPHAHRRLRGVGSRAHAARRSGRAAACRAQGRARARTGC